VHAAESLAEEERRTPTEAAPVLQHTAVEPRQEVAPDPADAADEQVAVPGGNRTRNPHRRVVQLVR
jgi:hypothetical protein